jgi:hypothetical protein
VTGFAPVSSMPIAGQGRAGDEMDVGGRRFGG